MQSYYIRGKIGGNGTTIQGRKTLVMQIRAKDEAAARRVAMQCLRWSHSEYPNGTPVEFPAPSLAECKALGVRTIFSDGEILECRSWRVNDPITHATPSRGVRFA